MTPPRVTPGRVTLGGGSAGIGGAPPPATDMCFVPNLPPLPCPRRPCTAAPTCDRLCRPPACCLRGPSCAAAQLAGGAGRHEFRHASAPAAWLRRREAHWTHDGGGGGGGGRAFAGAAPHHAHLYKPCRCWARGLPGPGPHICLAPEPPLPPLPPCAPAPASRPTTEPAWVSCAKAAGTHHTCGAAPRRPVFPAKRRHAPALRAHKARSPLTHTYTLPRSVLAAAPVPSSPAPPNWHHSTLITAI